VKVGHKTFGDGWALWWNEFLFHNDGLHNSTMRCDLHPSAQVLRISFIEDISEWRGGHFTHELSIFTCGCVKVDLRAR